MRSSTRIILALLATAIAIPAGGLAWLVTRDPLDLIARALPEGSRIDLAENGSAGIVWGLTPRLDLVGASLLGPDGLPAIKAERLRVEISLPKLLRGVVYIPDLSMIRGAVDIDALTELTQGQEADSDPQAGFSLPPILLEHALLDDVLIAMPEDNSGASTILSLDRLALSQAEDDPGRIGLDGRLETPAGDVLLDGYVGSPARLFEADGEQLPIQVTLTQGKDSIDLSGHYGMGGSGPYVDAMLRADIADLSPALEKLAGATLPNRFGMAGSARLTGPIDDPALDQIALLAGDGQDLVLSLGGRIVHAFQLRGMGLEFDAQLPPELALHEILPLPKEVVEQTSFTLHTTLAGDIGQPRLAGLNFHLDGPHGSLDLSEGNALLANEPGGDLGIAALQAQARLDLTNPRGLAAGLGLADPGIDALLLAGRVSYGGDQATLSADEGRLRLADLNLSATGTATALLGADGFAPGPFDLQLSGQANGRAALERLGLADAPVNGPYSLQVHAKGDPADFALTNLRLDAAGPNGLTIALRGSLGNLSEGLDLAKANARLLLNASAPSTQAFAELAGLQDVPPFGPTRLEAEVTGSPLTPAIGDVRMISGWPDDKGWILAFGTIEKLPLVHGSGASGVNLTVLGSMRDEQALTALVGSALPTIPPLPLRFSAALTDAGGKLALDDVVLTTARAKGQAPALALDGRIADVQAKRGIDLSGQLSIDAAPWIDALTTPATPSPALPMRGSITLEELNGAISLSSFNMVGINSEEGIQINGRMADLDDPESLNAELHLVLPSPDRLNRFAGLALPQDRPLSADISLQPAQNRLAIRGTANLGDSDATVDLTLDVDAPRPLLAGTVNSHTLRLSDFGLEAETVEDSETTAEQAAPPATPKRTRNDAAFSETPFDWSALHAIDLNLTQGVENLVGEAFTLSGTRMVLRLIDGRLEMSDLSTQYEGGHAEGSAIIDSSRDTPLFELDLNAKAMHLERVMAQLTRRVSLSGRSDLKLNLAGEGNSPLALARSARGEITMAIGAGTVNTASARLLSQNLFGWLFTGGALGSRVNMDCTMGRLTLNSGVAELERFAMVLEDAVLVGQGQIDLPAGWLDLTFVPRARRGLASTPTTLKATGPWEAPEIGPSNGAIPMKLAGDVLLAPLQLLGTLLPFLGGESRTPCAMLQESEGAANPAPPTAPSSQQAPSSPSVPGVPERRQ